MKLPTLIEVEEPHKGTVTMPLTEAIEAYFLDEEDIAALESGQIVWYKDIALAKKLDE